MCKINSLYRQSSFRLRMCKSCDRICDCRCFTLRTCAGPGRASGQPVLATPFREARPVLRTDAPKSGCVAANVAKYVQVARMAGRTIVSLQLAPIQHVSAAQHCSRCATCLAQDKARDEITLPKAESGLHHIGHPTTLRATPQCAEAHEVQSYK